MTRVGGTGNPLLTDTLGTSIGDHTNRNSNVGSAQVATLAPAATLANTPRREPAAPHASGLGSTGMRLSGPSPERTQPSGYGVTVHERNSFDLSVSIKHCTTLQELQRTSKYRASMLASTSMYSVSSLHESACTHEYISWQLKSVHDSGLRHCLPLQELQRTQRQGGNADQTLLNGISTIRRIGEGLGLNQRIQDRAGEIYKQVSHRCVLHTTPCMHGQEGECMHASRRSQCRLQPHRASPSMHVCGGTDQQPQKHILQSDMTPGQSEHLKV